MKNKKKSIDEMNIEELLEALRETQGPGDALMEIGPKGVRITTGEDTEKYCPHCEGRGTEILGMGPDCIYCNGTGLEK